MGAEYFENTVWASDIGSENIDTAFTAITEQAAWDHGHSGYTGTIAEKSDYILRSTEIFKSEEDAIEFTNTDMESEHHDKWGPAWVVQIDDPIKGKGWLFYGSASS